MGDIAEVAVDEFTQAHVVFDGTPSTATADVEFKIWQAEGVLYVDQHQPGGGLVRCGRLKGVLSRPIPRLSGAFFVGNPPDGADGLRVKKFRERELGHGVSVQFKKVIAIFLN